MRYGVLHYYCSFSWPHDIFSKHTLLPWKLLSCYRQERHGTTTRDSNHDVCLGRKDLEEGKRAELKFLSKKALRSDTSSKIP